MLKQLQLQCYIKMHTDAISSKCSIWIKSKNEYAVSMTGNDINN